jgi:hypothetical protein
MQIISTHVSTIFQKNLNKPTNSNLFTRHKMKKSLACIRRPLSATTIMLAKQHFGNVSNNGPSHSITITIMNELKSDANFNK